MARQVAERLGLTDSKGLVPRLNQVVNEHGHAINEYLVSQEIGSSIIPLVDGVTAPAAIVGVAQIYVDVADGDLKVRFSNGTTKTIATNP